MRKSDLYTSGVALQKKTLEKVLANKNSKPLRSESDLDRRERLLNKANEKKDPVYVWSFS